MSARAALRTRTAAEHERVDRLFSTFDLAREDAYRRFLLAQAAAFLPIEDTLEREGASAIIADWPLRRRGHLLRADLAALGAPEPEPIAIPPLTSQAAKLGAIYVLEGSRLGGAVLKRSLGPLVPRSFLSVGQNAGSWRKLLESLEMFLYRSDDLDTAVGAAKGVFQSFEAGGQLYLESASP